MRHRRLPPVWPAAILVSAALGLGAAPPPVDRGLLVVEGPSGTQVELLGPAGRFTGTLGEDGATFRGLTAGVYDVTLAGPAQAGTRRTATIRPGWVSVVRTSTRAAVAGAIRNAAVAAEGAVGALVVQTLPLRATVHAPKLGWRKVPIDGGPFIGHRVPAGTHKVTFCTSYKCIDQRLTIARDRVRSVLVDFETGDVEDLSATLRTVRDRRVRACSEGDHELCAQVCQEDARLLPSVPSSVCASLDPESPVRVNSDRQLPSPR